MKLITIIRRALTLDAGSTLTHEIAVTAFWFILLATIGALILF